MEEVREEDYGSVDEEPTITDLRLLGEQQHLCGSEYVILLLCGVVRIERGSTCAWHCHVIWYWCYQSN